MAIGGFWWYPRLIGTVINAFCACCCHFSAVVMLFVARFGPAGKLCSLNRAADTYDGNFNAPDNFGVSDITLVSDYDFGYGFRRLQYESYFDRPIFGRSDLNGFFSDPRYE